MREKLKEAIELFEEVLIYGTAHVLKTVDPSIWKEFSPEQLQVLQILSTQGPLSNGQLAVFQCVHKSAISARLKKLEEKGLICSMRDPTDQRSKIIQLTKEGKNVLHSSNEAIYEGIENLLSGKINEQEIDAFIKTFQRLKDILQMKGLS